MLLTHYFQFRKVFKKENVFHLKTRNYIRYFYTLKLISRNYYLLQTGEQGKQFLIAHFNVDTRNSFHHRRQNLLSFILLLNTRIVHFVEEIIPHFIFKNNTTEMVTFHV
uniref:Uncharacterized protein n=1 Tax=Octopus bimaculoides TaxID=37653 RepID=A0A0L8H858_OCTBM